MSSQEAFAHHKILVLADDYLFRAGVVEQQDLFVWSALAKLADLERGDARADLADGSADAHQRVELAVPADARRGEPRGRHGQRQAESAGAGALLGEDEGHNQAGSESNQDFGQEDT
jgi:hypothetical protein